MEVKENRPDACAASGTANSIYKDFSTDAPDIQEELTGPVLPDECAADIVSFCSEQTIAYDDLLEYATLFYLQDKDPEDPPFRDTLKFELLTLTNRCIDAYNFGKRDPNAAPGAKLKDAYPDKKEGAERYKRLSGLHTLQIAIILYKLHHAVGILWNNSHDDGNFDIGIYQYSGDNEGCYDVGEQNLKSLIRGYCKTGTIKDVNETIEALRAICPRVERCRNRDLVAVNNGIYDYSDNPVSVPDEMYDTPEGLIGMYIVELKTQLSESLTLNEKLNKENRAGNIQALKNDLKLADRALRIEKEKLRSANVMIEECQDKICYLTQERDYARTHQKIVEIPVEKPVLYEKCEACNRTAYQNAKARYETQKEQLAGQYKAKTVMFQTTLFLLAWYSLTTTLFQAVQSDMFLVDCKSFFNDLASFIQTFVGWTIDAGHSAAQISTKIPNAFIAGMVYWLLLILIVGICMAGTGMLAILIEIKVIELYKKNCWDVITLLMILTSVAIVIYFGESIKKVLSVNLLLLFVLSQGAYVGIRCYLKVWLEKRPY